MKKHLLIVEDEALIYRQLRNFLEEQNFDIADYTPSVDQALMRLKEKKPDLVLLDINLHGAKSGIDLGKILKQQFHIPFIYVTENSDDHTFIEAFTTDLEDFIVKTKPVIDEKELLRKIMIVLKRNEKQTENNIGLKALTNYLQELKKTSQMTVSEVFIKYQDIKFLTTDRKILNNQKIMANYVWLINKDNQIYYLRESLTKWENILPKQFVRINEKYIINLLSDYFVGRINGRYIQFDQKILKVTNTYKDVFLQRLKYYYFNTPK